ncbi:hypothetical protein Bpfe_019457, partial [Biomphalaria pfeifferi]
MSRAKRAPVSRCPEPIDHWKFGQKPKSFSWKAGQRGQLRQLGQYTCSSPGQVNNEQCRTQ